MAHFKSERWEIIEDLPETSQSWTHKVREKTSEKSDIYILKRLKNPTRLARFEKEIQALTYLDHSGIVHLIDYEINEEHPWFIQEYCAGGDLETYVKQRGLLDPDVALDFL